MSDRSGVILAFLTGQSDPSSTVLSVAQRDFAGRSAAAHEALFPANFPYSISEGSFKKTSLWRASWNNTLQYRRSRDDAFVAKYREQVLAVFDGYERMIFLAGSCGLELLVNLRLPEDFLKRVHVFAYGPVSRSLPKCASLYLVQGTADPISKLWHRRPDRRVRCHHMNYLESVGTLKMFDEFYHSINREAYVPG